MYLIFLIALLAVIVWLNRGIFGFTSTKCQWMKADQPGDDGSWKHMCQTCGQVMVTADGKPPTVCMKDGNGPGRPGGAGGNAGF